ADDNERMTVSEDKDHPGLVTVTYTAPDGTVTTQQFPGVTAIFADLGLGNNFIDCTGVAVPVQLQAEGGNNTLKGGDGNDTLTGNSGNDQVIAANAGDFTLSDATLTRSGHDNDISLVKIAKAHLTETGSGAHTFKLEGWSGTAVLNGGTGAETFSITAA